MKYGPFRLMIVAILIGVLSLLALIGILVSNNQSSIERRDCFKYTHNAEACK